MRTQPERRGHDDTLSAIRTMIKKPSSDADSLYTFKSNILNKPPNYLETCSDLKMYFRNVLDWNFVFLSSGKNSPDLRIFIGNTFKHWLVFNSWLRFFSDSDYICTVNDSDYTQVVFQWSWMNDIIKANYVVAKLLLCYCKRCTMSDRYLITY